MAAQPALRIGGAEMKTIKTVERVVSRISRFISYISFLGIVCMMLLIAVDVFLRQLFSNAIVGSYELVQYLLMTVVFASFSYTQTTKKHVRVTVLLARLPWRVHTLLNGLWELLCAASAAVMGYAACVQADYLVEKAWTSDVLRFPIAPFYYFEGVMLFAFALVILTDALRYFFAVTDQEYAEETFREYS